jgi:hypothetical protein
MVQVRHVFVNYRQNPASFYLGRKLFVSVHSVTKPNLTRAESQTSANSARAHFQVATAAATTTTVVVVAMAATAATVEAAAAATTTLDMATTETTVSGPFSFGHAPSHLYTPSGHDSSLTFSFTRLVLATEKKQKNYSSRVRFLAGPCSIFKSI